MQLALSAVVSVVDIAEL